MDEREERGFGILGEEKGGGKQKRMNKKSETVRRRRSKEEEDEEKEEASGFQFNVWLLAFHRTRESTGRVRER